MAQQNQKNIRKSPGGKASMNNTLKSNPKNKNKPMSESKSATSITEFGQKVKMINDVSTVDGTLHKDEVVKIESSGMGYADFKVIDNVGRFWFVNLNDISTKL